MKLDKSDFEDINEDNKWPIAFEEIVIIIIKH